MESEMLKNQRRRINGYWIIGILLVLIILSNSMFFVIKCINVDIILTYISFASTLLSITLSIFAIAYTYTSNNQVNRQFEQINGAARNIIETSHKLKETETLLKENLSKILSSIEDVKNSTNCLLGQFDNLNTNDDKPTIKNLRENMIYQHS